jgi:hypothetical protein
LPCELHPGDRRQECRSRTLAPKPDRPDIVTERMDRQFETMVRHLGLPDDAMERWKAERQEGRG